LSKESFDDLSDVYKNNENILKTENTPKERNKYFIKIKSLSNRYDSERSEDI
jgi:hypothetical protein